MEKYVVISCIFRIKGESYTEGYIFIDKLSNKIVKCYFALDKVNIVIKNNKLHLIISVYDPEIGLYHIEEEFISNCSDVSYLECPYSYGLRSKDWGNPGELQTLKVIKDPTFLNSLLRSISS